jgi:adhesin transport system membrane fusion protein
MSTPPQDNQLPFPYPRRCDKIATRAQRIFVATSLTGLALLLLWAQFTHLDKVTRGQGRVVPQFQNQTVQHFEGGIVKDILVREGDRVEVGAPILRLENSFSRAELEQARIEIAAREIKLRRLAAEANGTTFSIPAGLSGPAISFAQREMNLFEARRKTLEEQLAIIEEQRRQKLLEISELQSRNENTKRERALVMERLESLRRLTRLGAVSPNDLLDNERGLQQIDTRLSDLAHDMPRTESALAELARRRVETQLRFTTEAEKEASEVDLQLAKFNEAASALQDRSTRFEVLAPISGVVNKLFVTTVGGVVKSGEPLAVVVPAEAAIAVEARVSPNDRANVWPGLPAVIKVSAYDFSIYGGLKAEVTEVSPDALQDERGISYFRVRLQAAKADFGHDRPVLPGMIADVDIISGKRTIIEALVRPVRALQENALRN